MILDWKTRNRKRQKKSRYVVDQGLLLNFVSRHSDLDLAEEDEWCFSLEVKVVIDNSGCCY